MNDPDERLTRCFLAVFPALDREQVLAAGVDTTPDWDSLHALMLIAIIEEAFELTIPTSAYPQLRSYAAVRSYLGRPAGRTADSEITAARPGVAEPNRHE